MEVVDSQEEPPKTITPQIEHQDDKMTTAAVKNFEMIFNNTNTLLERYKAQYAVIEKQNQTLTEMYEEKIKA